ncbi:protein-glutamate O-methyltransferase CheR [Beggiatoa alba]|nr:protein-glutamate O-methyltransferase CheR [Beggiatoa alba]
MNDREFRFSVKDFKFISDVVAQRTGIVLSDAKQDMVYSRLARRLRQLRLTDFSQYINLLKSGHEEEVLQFTNAITTNLTSFFREKHHFDYLRKKVLPELKVSKREQRLRIWSAGCSSGEEAYSIAMTIRDVFPILGSWDIKILATDLDTNMVQRASAGVYTENCVEGLDEKHLKKWVKRGTGEHQGEIRMSPELCRMITFKKLNLIDTWPMSGPLDFIFCRNVVIYFNKKTQRELFERYAELLAAKGYLFIGHSESLHGVSERFELMGQTIYQKVK